MKRTFLIPLSALIMGIAVSVAYWFSRSVTLEIVVLDELTETWVWDCQITAQDKTLRLFYQSDRGVKPFRFTNLNPGRCVIHVGAADYLPYSREITLKRGLNTTEPFYMIASHIPNLQKFYIYERNEKGMTFVELRPVDSNGNAILRHPWVDIKVECRADNQNGTVYSGSLERTLKAIPSERFPYRYVFPADIARSNGTMTIYYTVVVPSLADNGVSETRYEITSEDVRWD